MRKYLCFAFLAIICGFSYGQYGKKKIAVLDFSPQKGLLTKESASEITNLLISELKKTDEFIVINSEKINNAINNLKLSKAKLNPKSFKKLGDSLDIDYIIQSEIIHVTKDGDIQTKSSLKFGDTVLNYKHIKETRTVFLDRHLVNVDIIDVSDGSAKYLVRHSVNEKKFEESIPFLSLKIANKILMQPIEIIKLSNILYVYPEDFGPIGVIEGYYICDDLNYKKMYGYDDWRPPTEEELKIILANKNLVRDLKKDYSYILNETHKVYNVPYDKVDSMKATWGYTMEDYKYQRYGAVIYWGKHYLRLVRGGIKSNE